MGIAFGFAAGSPGVASAETDGARTVEAAEVMFAEGDRDGAVALLQELVSEAAASGDAEGEAEARIQLGWYRIALGKGAEPETLENAERAVVVAGERGEEGSLFGRALQLKASVLSRRADVRGAVAHAERAVEVLDAAADADAEQRLRALGNLGVLKSRLGDLVGAGEIYEEVLERRRAMHGERHESVALALGNLAVNRAMTGDMERAVVLQREAISIERELGEPGSPGLAKSLVNFAAFLMHSGDLQGALDAAAEAVGILRAAWSGDHPDLANALRFQGQVLRSAGRFAEAREVGEESLAMHEATLGEHPSVAGAMIDLGVAESELGDVERALELFERATEIRVAVYGEVHVEVANSHLNLAGAHQALGDVEQATVHYERARVIFAEAFAPEHDMVAACLVSQADMLVEAGDAEAALPLAERSLALHEAALGSDHPRTLGSAQSVATALDELGRHERAVELLERVVAGRREVLGSAHPDVAGALGRLALARLRHGDLVGAFDRALEAEAVGRDHLRLIAKAISEREALQFARKRFGGLPVAVSALIADASSETPSLPADAVSRAWDQVARSRGLVFDVMARRQRAAAAAPDVAPLHDAVQRAATKLAALRSRGADRVGIDRHRAAVAAAAEDLERSRRRLAAELGTKERDRAAADQAGLDAVLAALGDDEALVAFHVHELAQGIDGRRRARTLVAFVVGPAGPEGETARVPRFVDLGPAADIDAAVASWRDSVTKPGLDGAARTSGEALRRLAWDPLAPLVGAARRVHVVADGALHLVSLGALPASEGGWLVEGPTTFHVLSVERDLIGTRTPRRPGGGGLLAVGGVDFDRGPGDAPLLSRLSTSARSALALLFRGDISSCADFASLRYDALPGTEREARDVTRTWREHARSTGRSPKTVFLTGPRATEEAFKLAAPGRSVLHLATHGFFLGDCGPAVADTRGVAGARPAAPDRASGEEVRWESPLLRSGLALAAFNARGEADPAGEDGVLTAEEISTLDLGATEWAVLSACESGRGELAGAEGVLGLQRAFRVAGADTVLMSLWAVDDDSTARWMAALHSARLERGRDAPDSVAAACRAEIAHRRAEGLSESPFYWGAFVASGDPR